MNINMYSYETRQTDPVWFNSPQMIPDQVIQHWETMQGAGFPVEPDPVAHLILEAEGPNFQGAMRVWLRLVDGSYVWVDTEGEAHFREAWS